MSTSFLPNVATSNLRDRIYQWLLELSTEQGINASGKEGVYGCIFGRDSALTILKILKAHNSQPSLELLETSRRALLKLVSLQGKEFNLESGEEPGKFIHEFRDTPEKMERLLKLENPWFVYPDNTIKNYDSIDSTPLTLIALYRYFEITQDNAFLISVLPAVEAGLNWIITYGDMDKDLLLEYSFPITRKHGGLLVQSWTDSHESIRQKNGQMPKYPIAPVEAQAYAWLALKLWGNFYTTSAPQFSQKLLSQSEKLKQEFNRQFIYFDNGEYFAAQVLDGDKTKIKTVTGNPLICLWASFRDEKNRESIIEDKYIESVVRRGLKDDLFDREGGIRTMSTQSETFNPMEDSYHNGSFWPVLNGLVHEGLEVWGFKREADDLKRATLSVIEYFDCPIELYVKTGEGKFTEYRNSHGQVGCRVQAWSAAATLDLLTP